MFEMVVIATIMLFWGIWQVMRAFRSRGRELEKYRKNGIYGKRRNINL